MNKMADERDATKKKTLLILGKAGNGKSSTANSILAGLNFQVYHSFTSNDLQCQAHENERIRVVCAPDLQQRKFIDGQSNKGAEVEIDEEEEVRSWIDDHCKGEPDAVILVIRCDQRFTPDETRAYMRLKEIPSLKEGIEKLVIVFTAGDRINGRDMLQELESDDPYLVPVRDIWNDAQKRYVVFDNTATKAKNKIQVNALIDVVERMACHPFPQHICRLLFVGPRATLGAVWRNLGIRGELGIFEHFDLNDLHLEMTLFCTDENEPSPMDKFEVAVSPGPHAILDFADGRFNIQALFRGKRRNEQPPRPSARHVGDFILRVGIDDFRNHEALSELLKRHDFSAMNPNKRGEFFRTVDLGDIAEMICEETMRRTERLRNAEGYDTYLFVKNEIIANGWPSLDSSAV